MEISPFTTQHHFYNISKYEKKTVTKKGYRFYLVKIITMANCYLILVECSLFAS